MAVLPINPLRLNVAAITAEQANNDSAPFLFNDDYSAWNDANQPLMYLVLGGNFFVSIDNPDIQADYVANWM